MKKLSLVLLPIFLMTIVVFSGCAKDDSIISGNVSCVISGTEYIADGATVYLMINETEYAQKTTTDADGYYQFYPVIDGTYHIEAEITVNSTYYFDKSDQFYTEKDDIYTVDLVLR
ncbi:MAG: carboxypeptidase-like regulatory domain-containing protein [Bacteroidota bacterium]|nr:carboxypeptidase-like regulatory domain-containing protein [Bacteroidota bacterium]